MSKNNAVRVTACVGALFATMIVTATQALAVRVPDPVGEGGSGGEVVQSPFQAPVRAAGEGSFNWTFFAILAAIAVLAMLYPLYRRAAQQRAVV